MKTCELHIGLENSIKTVEEKYDKLSDKVSKNEGKLEAVINQSQITDPCPIGVGIKATVDALTDRVDVLSEFKDNAIGAMATQTTQLKEVRTDVSEIKTDVKKLVGADTKHNIYWGMAIAILMLIMNYGIPFLMKTLSS